MTGPNDAELSVGIEDNLSPVLAKMAAQTKAFGAAIGAEARDIDRATKNITGSLARMHAAAGGAAATKGIGSAGYAKSIALASSNLQKYRSEMERLSHAADVRTTKSGAFQNVATGRFVSRADIEAYDEAKTRVKVYGDEVARLTRLQDELGAAQRRSWQTGSGGLPEHLRQAKIEAQGLSRSTADLSRMYGQMFGRVEAVNGRAANWWPGLRWIRTS